MTDADIGTFTQMLAEAQLAAVKAERITTADRPNRKRHYTGNSKRTEQYHAQKQQKLGETGQQFIQNFFNKKPDIERMPATASLTDSDVVEAPDRGELVEGRIEVLEEDEDEEPAVENLLQEMRKAKHQQLSIPETLTDKLLNGLSHKNFSALHHAQVQLNMESQNKKIDVFF